MGRRRHLRTAARGTTVAVAATTVLALAACGGVGRDGSGGPGAGGGDAAATDGSTGGAPGAGGGQGGRVETFGFGLPDAIATERVAAVEELGIEVDVVEGGFDQQQFLSAVAAGDPPDAVYLARTDVGTFAARGALQPMDECVDLAEVRLDDYREPALDQVQVDGVLYGLPEFYSVRVLLTDDDVLAEAGVEAADLDGSDYEALAEAAAAMSEGSGNRVERIGYDPKLPEFLPLWARANGVDVVAEDGRPNLDDPAVVEVVELAKEVVDEAGGWSSFQAFRDGWDFFGEGNQFAQDQLGAMPMEDWYVNVLARVSPDAGVRAQPFRDRDGNPITWATGSAWAIPEGVEDYESACRFAATMTAAETWVRAATARAEELREEGDNYTGTYTGNEAADEVIFSEVYEPTGDEALDQAVETILQVQEAAFSLPPTPAGAQLTTAYEQAVTRVFQGEQDAAAAMAQAQQEAEQAFEDAGGGQGGE